MNIRGCCDSSKNTNSTLSHDNLLNEVITFLRQTTRPWLDMER